MKNVRVELEDSLHRKLKIYAVNHDSTIQDVVIGLIKKLLDEESDKNEKHSD